MILLSLALAGCGGDPGPSLPEIERPSATPTWGPAELEAALADGLTDGFPESWSIREAYLELFTHGDAICPGHDDYIDDTWLYGCTAESGYWFSGISEHNTQSGAYDYWEVTGDMLFVDPADQRFEGGGHVFAYTAESGGAAEGEAQIMGTWVWEGHPGWLGGDGVSAALNTRWREADGGAELTIDGAASWSGLSLYFEELVFAPGCDHPVSGALSARDPSGAWHWIQAGGCDAPCGEARFGGADAEDGQPIGEVCLDLAPITDALGPRMGL